MNGVWTNERANESWTVDRYTWMFSVSHCCVCDKPEPQHNSWAVRVYLFASHSLAVGIRQIESIAWCVCVHVYIVVYFPWNNQPASTRYCTQWLHSSHLCVCVFVLSICYYYVYVGCTCAPLFISACFLHIRCALTLCSVSFSLPRSLTSLDDGCVSVCVYISGARHKGKPSTEYSVCAVWLPR